MGVTMARRRQRKLKAKKAIQAALKAPAEEKKVAPTLKLSKTKKEV